jgi:hypothetical protein
VASCDYCRIDSARAACCIVGFPAVVSGDGLEFVRLPRALGAMEAFWRAHPAYMPSSTGGADHITCVRYAPFARRLPPTVRTLKGHVAMGQILAIWKWQRAWPFRSESRVMNSLAKDHAPIALARFDAKAFADEIRRRFGDGDEAPFSIDVCDFTGQRANWLILSSGWSTPHETIDELLRMCADRDLHIFAAG